MGYSSRKLHRVPILSSRKGNLSTVFSWFDESWFLLPHLILCKQYQSMDPSWFVSTVYWSLYGVGDILWNILGTSESTKQHLSLPECGLWPFITKVSRGCFQQDNIHKAHIISDLFLKHDSEFNQMIYTVTSRSSRTVLWVRGGCQTVTVSSTFNKYLS